MEIGVMLAVGFIFAVTVESIVNAWGRSRMADD